MKTFELITNHLNFLGYRVETQKNGEKVWAAAKQDGEHTLVFFEILPELILFKVLFTTGKKSSTEMDTLINKLNNLLYVSKCYHYEEKDNTVTVVFETIYAGGYLKESFGQLYNAFEKERARIISSTEMRIFFDNN